MSDQGKHHQSRLDRIANWLEEIEPRHNRFSAALIRVGLLAWFCFRQLRRHRAEGMAAELTYRTVFSLIPVLVLGLVLFRVFGGLEDVQAKVESQLYDFFGVPDVMPSAYLEEGGSFESSAPPKQNTQPTDSLQSGDSANDSLSPLGISTASNAPTTQTAGPNSGGQSTSSQSAASEPSKNGTQTEVATTSGETDRTSSNEAATAKPDPSVAMERLTDAPAESELLLQSSNDDKTRTSIRRRMQEITRYVAAVDFRSMSVLGLLLFIYAAVALANTAETIFNRIFDVVSHRPFHLRLAIHWSMITLGSGLLAMSLSMSSEVIEWTGTVGADTGVQQTLRQFLSLTASWVLLFLLYALIPNIKVSLRAAAIGSLVSAVFWELGKYAFQIYIAKAVPYSAIYGSIGLLPLFLLWIYLTWWIVLFGLILTQTLQSYAGQSLTGLLGSGKEERTFSADWLLPILMEIAKEFHQGGALSVRELAKRLKISTVEAARAGETLVSSKLANYLDTADKTLSLARPADRILLDDVFALSKRITRARQHESWMTFEKIQSSHATARTDLTLAMLINTHEPPSDTT